MNHIVKALLLALGSGFVGLWLCSETVVGVDEGAEKQQATLKERATLLHASWIVFSPDGKTLASCGKDQLDRTIKLWDAATGEERATLKGHVFQIVCFAFSPDGKTLASASFDGKIKLWDVARGTESLTFKEGTFSPIGLAFSPDGKTLASAAADGLKLWDVATGKKQDILKGVFVGINMPSHSIVFSPDVKTAAYVTGDQHIGEIKLLDVATGKTVLVVDLGHGNDRRVFCVAFSPDGKTLASGCADGTLKLWDVATGKELATLTGHSRGLLCVAFSPDGKTLLASAAYDGTRLWDVARGKEVAIPKELANVRWVGYSPDGKTLASSEERGATVKLWDISPEK